MNRKFVVFGLAAAAVAACDSTAGPAVTEAVTAEAVVSASVAPPDPSSPVGFVAAVGERVIVCKSGPTAAGFRVADGETEGIVEVRPGDCAVVFVAGGATRSIEVTERVPAGQRLVSVQITQLTCGKGVGANCDPSSSPVIAGPSAASNPVTGLVGGTGSGGNPSTWGLSGFVAEFTNSFVPGDIAPRGETVIVCLRGAPRATLLIDDGSVSTEATIVRGCAPVYQAHGATGTVSLTLAPKAGWQVAQTFQSQLTCGLGRGVECDPSSFPVVTGPEEVSNPAVGYVGGSGQGGVPSQKGLSGFVVEFFAVR